MQIGAGGGGEEGSELGRVETEQGDDGLSHLRSGGGGEADNGHGGIGGAEMGEVRVGGAEVVAPFRDAVGFIDGDAGELVLLVHGGEVRAEGGC